MSHSAYLTVTGQRQGKIRGPVTLPGRKDSIRVYSGSHEIVSPRDAASGLPSGHRMHKPMTLVKEIDCSSPLLMNALVTNENLNEVALQFWQQDRAGRDVPYYTIRLLNATISGIRLLLTPETLPDSILPAEREELTFTYRKIDWTWQQGGISATDDWTYPVV